MRLRSLGVAAIWLSASVALADGCYMPERAVRKFPDIPAQRALLSWNDGVETLVISSVLDSESQRLGWIIPLPSVPQKMEKESPGGLKTLTMCVQPSITHDLYLQTKATVILVVVTNLLLAVGLFAPQRFVSVLLVLFLIFMCSGLLLPALGTIGSAATRTSTVLVEKTAAVGSYDVSVLRPSQPGDLNAWLDKNGFAALPKAGEKTVAGYIAQGWVFAAIKLRRAESGTNAPHPVKLVFAAKEAVYPLKLTALAGGSLNLELFVVANRTAACRVLAAEFCDRFTFYGGSTSDSGTEDVFEGATTRCRIGHPAIRPLMWNDCILTKLSGTVAANDMNEDIHFNWKPFQVYQQHFFSREGARSLATILFLALAGGWAFLSMAISRRRIVQPGGLWWYLPRRLLPGVLLCFICAGIVFLSVPKLGAAEVEVSSAGRRYRSPLSLYDVETFLKNNPGALQGSGEEIADRLLKYVEHRWKGAPDLDLKVEDTPGNFTVEKQPGKVVVRAYSRNGTVWFSEYPVP